MRRPRNRRKSGAPLKPEARSSPQTPLPVWKKLLFAVITCGGFFLLLELGLALFGVRPVLYAEDPYVGFTARIPLFVRETDRNGETILVTASNKVRFFNPQQFPAKKPRDTCRIFCLGGSTTYGHPYDDRTSFCGWLRAMLPKADPSRRWEVINCGGISYASYRIAVLMEELVQYQPDLFIIYNGENEFLEQRTYRDIIAMPGALRGVGALLSRTRVHSAAKTLVDKFAGRTRTPAPNRDALPAEVETMLDRVVGPQAYTRDERLQRQVLDHYRFNLRRMLTIARSASAQVMLVTPTSNLRDCAPFKSENRPGLADAQR